MIYTIDGGPNTATTQTLSLTLSAETNISTVNIPVMLASNNSVKSVTVTITVDEDTEKTVTKTFDYDTTEHDERTVSFDAGLTGKTSMSIRCICKNATIDYGTYTYPFILGEGVSVARGAYNMTLSISVTKTWGISSKNDGYPLQADNSIDASVFMGYGPPKPLDSWKIDSNNNGYPWTWGFTEIIGGSSIFFKTADGLVPLTAYYKNANGLIPLTFIKIKQSGNMSR